VAYGYNGGYSYGGGNQLSQFGGAPQDHEKEQEEDQANDLDDFDDYEIDRYNLKGVKAPTKKNTQY